MSYPELWDALHKIADALDATCDPHGLIDVPAVARADDAPHRYVLVDHDEQFRVGLYEGDDADFIVMIETSGVDDTICAARALSQTFVEVGER